MTLRTLAFAAAATLSLPLPAETPGWPAFRGPNSSGLSAGARPPVQFGLTHGVLWKAVVPWSPSSPSVWGGHIFLTTFDADKLLTQCYSAADGKLLWSRPAPADKLEDYHLTEGSPAAATPATDGHHVVSYFGSYGLIGYDVAGKELWKQPLPVATTAGGFGSGTSPLIVGDKVILNRDMAADSSLLAFDLKTGRPLWQTPRADSPTSYGSPIVRPAAAGAEIIMAGSLTMKAYDVATGAERWVVHGLPGYTCTTPVLGDGLVFFAGWSPGKSDSPWPSWQSTVERLDKNHDGKISLEEFDSGPVWFKTQDVDKDGFITQQDWDLIGGLMKRGENVLLAVKPGGTGDLTATHVVWKATRGLPYVPSPLYYDGRVYLIRDGGMMSSFDAKTGQPFYQQERVQDALGSYYASPVAADGRIYVASLDGKVSVIKAGGDRPEVIGRADFGERISATPALVDDRLYLRTKTKLYALGGNATR